MIDQRFSRSELEFQRNQADMSFGKIKQTWIDLGTWALPYRTKWLLGEEYGKRNNQHVTDTTHTSALRSYVAGFLEGNTSATRPWFRQQHADPKMNAISRVKRWLDHFNERCIKNLSSSNFYHEAGRFYYDYGVFNTGTHFIIERPGGFFFYTLDPGSYRLINDAYGMGETLIQEKRLNVKALVKEYGGKDGTPITGNQKPDWNNFNVQTRLFYEKQQYQEMVNFVIQTFPNPYFDPSKVVGGKNRQWVTLHYEILGNFTSGPQQIENMIYGAYGNAQDNHKFLRVSYSKRKPFIGGKSLSSGNFPYGETGPTLDSYGLIRSTNKKALSKDKAIEKMVDPAVQGPANLRKSHITTQSNRFVPLDPMQDKAGGLRTIHEVNPAIGTLINDVEDLRQQINKNYYADFLLYLSMNPKTRTAEETRAIVSEQQMVIGPNLQSLNWTYNTPVTDFVASWTLDMDPYLEPPPPELAGQFLRTEFISVFAQAQRAADLPAIDRYVAMITNVGQIDPRALQKLNTDRLADLYEDRLYLPEGLNKPQSDVDRERQQAQAMAQRQQAMQETLPAMAGAAKDIAAAQRGPSGG